MPKKYLTYNEYINKHRLKNRTVVVDTDGQYCDNSATTQGQEDYSRQEEILEGLINMNLPVTVITPAAEPKKKKNKQAKSENGGGISLFGLLVVLLSLMIAVTSGTMLANGLNLGHVLGSTKRIVVERQIYYGVSVGGFSIAKDAYDKAVDTRYAGGAGYIVHEGGLYNVIANIYKTESECQQIIDRMTGNFSGSKVLIEMPHVNFDYNGNISDKESIEICFELLKSCAAKLYDYSVQLDTASSGEEAVKLDMLQRKNTIGQSITKLDAIIEKTTDLKLIRLKSELNVLSNKLNELIRPGTVGSGYSAEIKFAYCATIFSNRSFYYEMNA